MGEPYEGTYGSADPASAQEAIRSFLSGYEIITLTDPIVAEFARLRALLRRQGNLIPDLDLLIAATAIVYHLTLATRNRRHYARVPGLRLAL